MKKVESYFKNQNGECVIVEAVCKMKNCTCCMFAAGAVVNLNLCRIEDAISRIENAIIQRDLD